MSTEGKVTRKLRAILSAIAKGYRLLLSDDEALIILFRNIQDSRK
jgi:hypothetical protein